jgi:hypothetical protein
MRHAAARLALAALVVCVGPILGCDGPQDPLPRGSRISRQDHTDSAGALMQYWTYTYDAAGYATQVSTFNASGVLQGTTVYTNGGGVRTQATSRSATGTVTGWTTFAYDTGVLSEATQYTGAGAVLGQTTYVFVQGKKVTTNRYSATGAYAGRTEFSYDAATGHRLGSTSYDSVGAVTGTSTRTYSGDVFTEAQVGTGPSATHRIFTYGAGPSLIDLEPFFEF